LTRCRYDLGSGAAVLRSREAVRLNMVHKLTARRFVKDASLKLDGGAEVIGSSPGTLKALNINTPLYLGHVPNMGDA